jgi:hypothetical protein
MIDSISLVGFLVLGIIGWITYKIYIWPNYISPLRKIPGPPSENPFFGNIKTFMKEEVIYFLFLTLTYFNYSLNIFSFFFNIVW